MLTLVIPVCLAVLLASPAAAQDKVRIDPDRFTGTSEKIKNSGAIRLGYPEHTVPFAFLADGHPVGYSIDLCLALVAARWAPSSAASNPASSTVRSGPQNRFSLLIAGDIDLECGSSTNSAERREKVSFSPVIFVTGTKLLVKRASPVNSLRDLRHKTIVVTAGTTNATAVEALSEKQRLGINFVVSPIVRNSYEILVSDKAGAFANDEVLLNAWIAEGRSRDDYRIAGACCHMSLTG